MAHFYSKIQGGRGEATRCGTKNSGVTATAASWNGAISVEIHHNRKTGEDTATVYMHPWNGDGVRKTLYSGPVGEFNNQID